MYEHNAVDDGLARSLDIRGGGQTYCWEVTEGKDAKQTGLSASTVTNNHELPMSLIGISTCGSERAVSIPLPKRAMISPGTGDPVKHCLTTQHTYLRMTLSSGCCDIMMFVKPWYTRGRIWI